MRALTRLPPTEVLIVKLQALGDVLRTTSLLEPLRRRGPCRVTWLTKRDARPLLEGNPHLADILTLDPSDEAAAARMAARLSGRFDLVLSLEEDAAVARVAAAARRGELVGVTVTDGRLGYTPSSAGYYDMSLLAADKAAADRLKAANRRSFARLWLRALGLEARAPRPLLRLTPRERAAARRAAPGRRPLGFNFNAGARWPAKQVSDEQAARLLAACARAFRRPLLVLGGKEPQERARNRRIAALAARLEPSARPRLAPPLPLRAFAALIERCAALVTTDSLALHAAAALGRPAVALVGPTSAAELDFAGAGTALTPPGGCACFYRARCERAVHCLDALPASAVIAALRRCLR